jgi:asparagine synthase (glutamine-hydrolysing)
MCGIAGFISHDGAAAERLAILQRMTRSLAHRGPDSEGYWQSSDGRVNLGHRRLAIIDLSPAGHQPMLTPDGGQVLSFNGEIYNFPELKAELAKQGVNFRGSSDTEVLLQALVNWGVEPTLKRLNGMFAFSYWDGKERKLWLARDRFGEKPLFYSWQNGMFFFGSELKALGHHPSFEREIDRSVLPTYLRFNYVPWPQSIFKNVNKLTPGHFLEVDLSGEARASKPYWQLREMVETRRLDRRAVDDPTLIDDLDRLLSKAVRQRMLSDVPLGAFLSGGIDSSTIVALMQKQSSRPVKTFTIGFSEAGYNEAQDAAKVAKHLGTEHHEYYISSPECVDVIARLPQIYDEPFADSSQIPTTLVAQFTRKHVTVALSGDAGDELFGGYNRYVWSRRIWPLINSFPAGLRRIGRNMTKRLSPAEWDRIFSFFNPILPHKVQVRGAGEKLHKLAASVGAKDTDALYRSFVSQWQNPEQAVIGHTESPSLLDNPQACPAVLHYLEKMMYLDQMTYMPSDILCKVDRATMSASLEARVPFLDNELAQFAWSLPMATKLHRGASKWPLRQVLKRYVPEEMFERPKAGFGIPIGDWLRGPLRDWAEELLSERALKDGGYFQAGIVRNHWAEHFSGRQNLQHSLWGILMFEAWRRQ